MVLAAGAGTRLRPLTRLRPKALCPVGDRPLVDHAIERVSGVTTSVAVNVHHGRDALEAHLAGRAHVSVEPDHPLGTAGALGALRPWIDGRAVLVVNADGYTADPSGMRAVLDGWDGERVRVVVAGAATFGPGSRVVAALHPWADVADLPAEPCGLYERSWAPHAGNGDLDVVGWRAPFVDCGTPARYLAANLLWSGGRAVLGAGATVHGDVERTVVWPGGVVRRGERLVDAIRAGDRVTVLVRSPPGRP